MKRVLKWIGVAVAALAGLAVVVAAVMVFVGGRYVGRSYAGLSVQPVAIPAPRAATLAEGRRLVQFYTCQACHGADLGGQVMADAPPWRLVAPNLTAGEGGIGRTYTDVDWVRALHHGAGQDGRPLLVMPSGLFANIDATRLGAMVAYLKRLPPVDRTLPPTEVRLPGRLIAGLAGEGLFAAARIDHERPIPAGRAPAPEPEYGAYLASTYCVECHGADLRGGQGGAPGSPPAPDLAASGAWPEEAFARVLRTGVTPAGARLDPAAMPWPYTRHLTDVEIAALHRHLRTRAMSAPLAGSRP